MNSHALSLLVIALMVYRGWTFEQVQDLLGLMCTMHEEEKERELLFTVETDGLSNERKRQMVRLQNQLDRGQQLVYDFSHVMEAIK